MTWSKHIQRFGGFGSMTICRCADCGLNASRTKHALGFILRSIAFTLEISSIHVNKILAAHETAVVSHPTPLQSVPAASASLSRFGVSSLRATLLLQDLRSEDHMLLEQVVVPVQGP